MKILKVLLLGCSAFFLLQSSVLAQESNTATFNLNQANLQLNLGQKLYETIYRTDQVPSTCYRDEIHGYRTECRTNYEQVCRYENYPVCQQGPRGPVCHNEQRYVCQTIPRQYCTQVPNVVRVAYACTRPVQVPNGQVLKLDTHASVSIQFANFSEVGAAPDTLVATLNSGIVGIKALNTNAAYFYQIIGQQRSEQMISSTEKIVNYQFMIKAVSMQKLNAFYNSQISNAKLFGDRLEFSLAGQLDVPFKGHLKLVQIRSGRSDLIIINDDFSSSILPPQGNVTRLALNQFGMNSLIYKNYIVELGFKLDAAQFQNGINPEILNVFLNRAVEVEFESYPN